MAVGNCNFSLEILLAWSSNLIVTYMLEAELTVYLLLICMYCGIKKRAGKPN